MKHAHLTPLLIAILFNTAPMLRAITIPVAEDTFSTAKNSIGVATGKATSLAVSSKNRAFILFSLSDLPPATTEDFVLQARLHIFTNRVLKPGVLEVRTVTSSWSENADTGSVPPTVDNDPAPLASVQIPVGKHFFVIDVTAAVKKWIKEPSTNHGLAFLSKGAVGKFYLGSKEGSGTGHSAILELDLAPALPGQLFTANGNLDGQAVEPGSIGTAQIGTGAVLVGNLGLGAVTADRLGDSAVTLPKLNTNSVDSSKIVDGSIAAEDVAHGAIGTSKLADEAVTEGQISDGAVTTAKLADGAVTGDKIANGSITPDKLAIPQVFVKAQKNTAQSLPTGSTTITGWVEASDDNNAFDPETGVFTAPVAGKYRVTWLAFVGPTAWAQGDSIELRAGGEVLGGTSFAITLLAATSQYVSGSSVFPLTAGATLSVAIAASRASAIPAGAGGANRVIIERIGD